jgi:hypothetical protein
MPMLSHLYHLCNAAQCQASIHTLRWQDRPRPCPRCQSHHMGHWGTYHYRPGCRRSWCQSYTRTFNDLTDTLLHQSQRPLAFWILATCLVCLACSSRRIARKVGVHVRTSYDASGHRSACGMDDVHAAYLLYTRRGKGRTLALRLGRRCSHACSVLGDWSGRRQRDGPLRRRSVIPPENQHPLASVASPCVLPECAAVRIPLHAARVQIASAWTFHRFLRCYKLREIERYAFYPQHVCYTASTEAYQP